MADNGNRVLRMLLAWCVLLTSGCVRDAATEAPPAAVVIAYVALDEEFSRPLLDTFSRTSGIQVRAKYDIESTKTVGLTQAILAESQRPVCDLFWNNEILHTLRLKRQGCLQPFQPAHAPDFPAAFRDPDGMWYGFAARARILLVNTQRVSLARRPQGLADLLDPAWKGQVGLAKPLFGTTATHAACLFAAWGPERARRFFLDLKANEIQILSGNKQVAQAVAAGELAFGLTDTDDALVELDASAPVAIIYPDQGPDGMGTLFIPNTLALVRGSRHAAAATALAGYLLSPEVEARLARGPSGQIPLGAGVTTAPRIETPATIRPMEVDFERAAAVWDQAIAFLLEEYASN